MMGTINCVYETPCGWCSKWDKKCDKKAPERGQRIKCGPVDDAANELGGVIMTPEEFAKKAQEIYTENERPGRSKGSY